MKEAETMITLKSPFHQVEDIQGEFYGGNQRWFPYGFLRGTGCGVIAATDLIFHLRGREYISRVEYMDFAKELWKKYLPVIPGFGMNGLTLMLGLNGYFAFHKMPYRAAWMLSGKKMISRIEKMLSLDIPVIMAIGPNFPLFWKKEKLSFYTKDGNGKLCPAVKTKAHFVTVTGISESELQISSWGKKYYISIQEYEKYVREHSSPLVSNIIYVVKYNKRRH